MAFPIIHLMLSAVTVLLLKNNIDFCAGSCSRAGCCWISSVYICRGFRSEPASFWMIPDDNPNDWEGSVRGQECGRKAPVCVWHGEVTFLCVAYSARPVVGSWWTEMFLIDVWQQTWMHNCRFISQLEATLQPLLTLKNVLGGKTRSEWPWFSKVFFLL